MNDEIHQLLATALDWEKKTTALRWEEKPQGEKLKYCLNNCLGAWQKELDICSFATAFAIQGSVVLSAYNGLEESEKLEYKFFRKLIEPPSDVGEWPWDILREEEWKRNKNHGMFPAELKSLARINLPSPLWVDEKSSLWVGEKSLSETLYDDFKIEADPDFSWKWYAYYPALLGDKIRLHDNRDNKKSRFLIYIFGTRREFIQVSERELDYGLIVGLDVKDEATAEQAKEAILAAWNILVVAEHIIADAKRIENLEAARTMSHTFRTFVESSTLPNIRTILRSARPSQEIENHVESALLKVGQLAAFMGFVARGGLSQNQIWDFDIEPQNYNPFLIFKEQFEAAEKIEPTDKPIQVTFSEVIDFSARFAKKLYLEAICQELIRNARDHGTPLQDGKVAVTVMFAKDGKNITITISNSKTDNSDEERSSKQGLLSLRGMVEACGGALVNPITDSEKLLNPITDSGKWETTLTFDLVKWETVTVKSKVSELTRVSDSLQPDLLPNIRKHQGDPTKLRPSIRVLLLDDEVGIPQRAEESLSNLGKPDDWEWYECEIKRETKLQTFICYWNREWNLEIMLCRSIFLFRDYLLDKHFDICLVDVDFKKDSERRHHKVPSLGGFLAALPLAQRAFTYCTIFTAKRSELVSDPNYSYLRELSNIKISDKKVLGNLDIDEEIKELSTRLQLAFEQWAFEIFEQLGPQQDGLVSLVEALSNKSFSQIDKELKLNKKIERGCKNTMPIVLFTLLPIESYPKAITKFSQMICGHQLVRRAFCKVIHRRVREALYKGASDALPQSKDEASDALPQSKINEFFDNLKQACALFTIDEKQFINKLKNSVESDGHKRFIRVDISKELTGKVNSCSVLFGLFEDPASWIRNFKHALKGDDNCRGLLCEPGGNCPLQVKGEEPSDRCRKISIIGNLQNKGYITEVGGSWTELVSGCNLGKIASTLQLVGPSGTVDMKTRQWIAEPTADRVTLEIIVHHTLATEFE